MSSQTIFIPKDTTSYTIDISLQDSTDGSAYTGLVAADLTLNYKRGAGLLVSQPLSDLAAVNSAFAEGGFKELNATTAPGVYRLDLVDLALATGADSGMFVLAPAGVLNVQPHIVYFNLADAPLTENSIAVAISNMTVETEGAITLSDALAYILSFAAGVTDTTTTPGHALLKSPDGVAVRIDATINTTDKTRTAVTLNAPA